MQFHRLAKLKLERAFVVFVTFACSETAEGFYISGREKLRKLAYKEEISHHERRP